jgi:hypothetical protein
MEQKYETAEHESIYLLENAKNRAWFNKKGVMYECALLSHHALSWNQ